MTETDARLNAWLSLAGLDLEDQPLLETIEWKTVEMVFINSGMNAMMEITIMEMDATQHDILRLGGIDFLEIQVTVTNPLVQQLLQLQLTEIAAQ